MIKQTIKFTIVFCAVLLISSPAWAAKGFRMGFGFGTAFPVFSGDVIDDFKPEPGIAWDIIDLGYGFTDALSLNFKIMGAGGAIDTSGLEHKLGGRANADFTWTFAEYALDARYAFMTKKSFNPFLLAGIGLLSGVQIEGDVKNVEINGKLKNIHAKYTTDPTVGFDVGGGFEYYLGQRKRWSVGSQVYYHIATYKDEKVEVEHNLYDLNSHIHGGIILWPVTFSYTFRR